MTETKNSDVSNICNLCPKKCGVDRDFKKGFCNQNNDIKISLYQLHKFEEPVISGKNGSGAIFFCGCNMRCKFCQNSKISRGGGKTVTNEELTDIFNKLINMGANNINLVTPTHYTKKLSEILENNFTVPIVWNSSGYELPESIKLLNEKVDIFMPDLKYSDNDLALKYSFCGDYFEYAKKAIEQMVKQTKPLYINENGIMQSGVLIRHLVLPGQITNTKKIIDYVSKTYKNDVLFSLMFQYIPFNLKNNDPLNRKVNKREYDILTDYLFSSDIENGFVQELSSANKVYIPDFAD